MHPTDLVNPGTFYNAQAVRVGVAHAITQIEEAQNRGSTPDPDFVHFLIDASAKTPNFPGTVLQPDQAVVWHTASTQLMDMRGANTGAICTLHVENRALLAAKLPATAAVLRNGGRLLLDGTQYTFTVADGRITKITSVKV